MKKIITFSAIGLLAWTTSARAVIYPIEDYQKNNMQMIVTDALSEDSSFSCESNGYLSEQPTLKSCNVIKIKKLTCYSDCQCDAKYQYSCNGNGEVGVGTPCDGKYTACTCLGDYTSVCSGVEVGVGTACTADGGEKYTACECPANYDKECNGPGEVGVGSECGGKYAACKCESSWVSCVDDAGEGEACTADGGKKFDYCLVGGAGSLCRAVTDATPNYGTDEYMQHANAFRGIENTKALIAAHGDAATAAQLATNYYPHGRTDNNCAVSEGNRYFGKGKWYLPAAGEMLYLAGTDFSAMTGIEDQSAINGSTFETVNGVLGQLYSKSNAHLPYGKNIANNVGGNIMYGSPTFWTSSEGWGGYPYIFVNKDWFYKSKPGVHLAREKYYGNDQYALLNHAVYPALMLEHCFDNANIAVGDVLFSDMSTKSITDYTKAYADDCRHFPLGVIYWISPDKSLVRVLSSYDTTIDYYHDVSKQGLINKNGSGYNEEQYNVADIPDDVWGCSSINPDDKSCTNAERERATLTSTPCDGSSEYLAYANAFNGREYTDAIVAQHGSGAVAAYAASQFYSVGVAADDPFFGKGKWYLPAAGEALYMSGVDFNAMNDITDTSGVNGAVFNAIENQLATMQPYSEYKFNSISAFITPADSGHANYSYFKPGAASPRIWTSSELNADEAYYWDSATKSIAVASKQNPDKTIAVRPVMTLKDPAFVGNDPQVGDIVYNHFYISKDYNSPYMRPYNTLASTSIRPIGIIYWVSADKRLVRIVSVSTIDIASGKYNNITHNPANAAAKWLKTSETPVDVAAIPNDAWDYPRVYTYGDFHNGKTNTQGCVNRLGSSAYPYYYCYTFYPTGVEQSDPNFGKGQWYLPAVGELLDMAGIDGEAWANYSFANTTYYHRTGINYQTRDKLNTALQKLIDNGVTANLFGSEYYWAASKPYRNKQDRVSYYSGVSLEGDCSTCLRAVRPSLLLENKFTRAEHPSVGDIMYSDMSYSSPDNYDSSKTPVGVVYWVGSNGGVVRVTALTQTNLRMGAQTKCASPAMDYQNYGTIGYQDSWNHPISKKSYYNPGTPEYICKAY